jgi:hypothetical protein
MIMESYKIVFFSRIDSLRKPSQKSDHAYFSALYPKIVADINVSKESVILSNK